MKLAVLFLALGAAVPAQVVPGHRETRTLSQGWQFQIDVSDLGEKDGWFRTDFNRSAWARVPVPKAWDLLDPALFGYEGLGWYAVDLDGAWSRPGKWQRLEFGRVGYHAKVWLNGELLGENTNGWLPFEFDVSGRLRTGLRNRLVLRVDNRPRLEWLPAAKKIEWVQYGGILGPVALETADPVHIADVAIAAPGPEVRCRVSIAAPAEQELVLKAAMPGASATATVRADGAKPSIHELTLVPQGAARWQPAAPQLYELVLTLERGGRVLDRRTEKFGIRKVETRGTQILLNGEPVRIQGVNRYDEYGGYGPNPPRELVIRDLQQMKRAGVNFVRMHYPQSPELLSLYDEMGFMVMEELPLNWWGTPFANDGSDALNPAIIEQARPALERMIARDKNHPAIVIWSMANESGTSTEIGIRVMRELIGRTHQLDPSRLVTFVISGGDASKHEAYAAADLVATNVYLGQFTEPPARHVADLEELVYKPSLEYLRRTVAMFPGKPVMVAEYGTRGVPSTHGDVEYTEDFQAAFIQSAWKAIREAPGVSGGVLWCWADYYHRRDLILYAAFGPYGVVTVDRRPKAALGSLTKMYGGPGAQQAAPAAHPAK